MHWTLRLLILGCVAYAAICAVLFLLQRRLLYPMPPGQVQPHYPPCRLVNFSGPNGESYAGMYAQARAGQRTVVAFHGNGEDISNQGDLAAAFTAEGLGFLAVEYPGYGILRGTTPTEEGNYAAAAAALRWLREQGVTPLDTVLYGQSLGSGVAVEMARHKFAGRVVLVSPYASMVRMARKLFPIVPAGLLLKDKYDNLAKASQIEQPVLVVHGVLDEIVPYKQGKKLSEALPNSRLVTLEDLHHNDLPLFPGTELMTQVVAFAQE